MFSLCAIFYRCQLTLELSPLGKAAVGDYFWEHIFRESREPRDGGLWFEGKGKRPRSPMVAVSEMNTSEPTFP